MIIDSLIVYEQPAIMKLIKITENQAEIQFTRREMSGLNSTLNTITGGISVPNFESRIGMEKEKVRQLLKAIRIDIINTMDLGTMPQMVFDRERQIRKELNFQSIKNISDTVWSQIRQESYLVINSRIFVFLLCNVKNRSGWCGNRILEIGLKSSCDNQILEIKLKDRPQILAKTFPQHLYNSDFFRIVAYLELCLELAKNKIPIEPYKISPYNRQTQQLFSLQVLSGHLTSEAGGFLQLRLHLQTAFQKEQENSEINYLEVEGAVSFEDILKFTASIREFMTKLTSGV